VREVRVSVRFAAPQQAVWEALVDWSRQGEWMPATTVRVAAGNGRGLGARLEARTGFGPLQLLDRMTITGWEPPRRCAVEHTGRVIRGSASFEVRPLGERASHVVWSERLVAPSGVPDALAGLALRPATAAVIRTALRRLARRLAAGSAGTST
jgi:carbon monoxide dehydrogenase subunit G